MRVKLEWLGYRVVKKLWRYVKPFSSDTGTLRTDRRTDRQTDRFVISISRVSMLTRDNNHPISMKFCTQQQILNWTNVTWSKMKQLHWTDSDCDRTYFFVFLVSIWFYCLLSLFYICSITLCAAFFKANKDWYINTRELSTTWNIWNMDMDVCNGSIVDRA